MSRRPSNRIRSGRRLSVTWSDSVWFPVLARERKTGQQPRRQVQWACQIITDPTVCLARTVNPL